MPARAALAVFGVRSPSFSYLRAKQAASRASVAACSSNALRSGSVAFDAGRNDQLGTRSVHRALSTINRDSRPRSLIRPVMRSANVPGQSMSRIDASSAISVIMTSSVIDFPLPRLPMIVRLESIGRRQGWRVKRSSLRSKRRSTRFTAACSSSSGRPNSSITRTLRVAASYRRCKSQAESRWGRVQITLERERIVKSVVHCEAREKGYSLPSAGAKSGAPWIRMTPTRWSHFAINSEFSATACTETGSNPPVRSTPASGKPASVA